MNNQQGLFEPPVLVPIVKKTVGLPWYKQIAEATRSRKYVLRENWRFFDSKGNICMIPAGQYSVNGLWRFKSYFFSTDGTSWPRPVQILFDKMGIGLAAALSHDFAIRYHCFLSEAGEIIREFNTRKAADDEYRLIDIRVNGMTWLSNTKWAFLRIGSWFAWRKYDKLPPEQTNALLLR